MRLVGLVLAAAILPSCRHDDDKVGELDVTVHNEGTVSAEAWAGAENRYDPSDLLDEVARTVGPGESLVIRFSAKGVGGLRVRISRSTDHFEIFDEHWDAGELWDVSWRVTITVTP